MPMHYSLLIGENFQILLGILQSVQVLDILLHNDKFYVLITIFHMMHDCMVEGCLLIDP